MTEKEPKKKKYLCCFNDKWCKEESFRIWLRKVDEVTAEYSLCYIASLLNMKEDERWLFMLRARSTNTL